MGNLVTTRSNNAECLKMAADAIAAGNAQMGEFVDGASNDLHRVCAHILAQMVERDEWQNRSRGTGIRAPRQDISCRVTIIGS
jgi:hypothetical protein